MIKLTSFLLLFNILAFCFFIVFIFQKDEFQYASIISETSTLLVGILLFAKINSRRMDFAFKPPLYLVIIVIVGNAVVGILNLDYITSQINFDEVNQKTGFDILKISMISSSLSIFLSQVGGYFVQAFLTIFLIQIIGVNIKAIDVFKALGIAYSGFLFISIIIYIYNLYYLDYFYSFKEFDFFICNSTFYLITGKVGEYLTLLIAVFIYFNVFQIKYNEALIISFLPNILLMSSSQLFYFIL